jgi:hypothetical protein
MGSLRASRGQKGNPTPMRKQNDLKKKQLNLDTITIREITSDRYGQIVGGRAPTTWTASCMGCC